MPKFQVTIVETVAPGSLISMHMEVEATDAQDAIEKIKPHHASKYGRHYVVKPISGATNG